MGYVRERKARNPKKGLKVRFRTEMNKLGITGKYKLDELRSFGGITRKVLVVSGLDTTPILHFDGYDVKYI